MTSSPAPIEYSDEELRPSRKESRGRELNVYDAVVGMFCLLGAPVARYICELYHLTSFQVMSP